MKSRNWIIFLIVCIIVNGCECQDCAKKLEGIYNKINYRNNEIVQFSDSLGNIRSVTIHVNYDPVPNQACGTTDHQQDCWGIFKFVVGDFVLDGSQGPNYTNNETSFGYYFISDAHFYKHVYKVDTILYEYHGNKIIALHNVWYDPTEEDNNSKHYSEFIISKSDYRLLKYCIIDNDINTCWTLK